MRPEEGPFKLPRQDKPTEKRAQESARPTQATTAPSRPSRQQPSASRVTKSAPNRKFSGWLFAIIGLVVGGLLVGVGYFLYPPSDDTGIDKSNYQAVFSTNGQVYFGKLSDSGGQYLHLADVYYVQPRSGSDTDITSGDLELVKLGKGEVYGPKDEMIFVKDQVLYYQNLKSDSQVAELIKDKGK